MRGDPARETPNNSVAPFSPVGHDLTLGQPAELIVLACKSNSLRCRVLGTACEVTLRTAVHDEAPGEIVAMVPTKLWSYAGRPCLSGEVQSHRNDVEALGLTPLAL